VETGSPTISLEPSVELLSEMIDFDLAGIRAAGQAFQNSLSGSPCRGNSRNDDGDVHGMRLLRAAHLTSVWPGRRRMEALRPAGRASAQGRQLRTFHSAASMKAPVLLSNFSRPRSKIHEQGD